MYPLLNSVGILISLAAFGTGLVMVAAVFLWGATVLLYKVTGATEINDG